MKKAIRLVTFIVALSMLALSATAFTAAGGGDVAVDGTFTVDITNTIGGALAASVIVTTTGGVELVSAEGKNSVLAHANPENGKVGLVAISVAEGAVAATLTFKATAAGAYSISFAGEEDYDGLSAGPISGTVTGGGEVTTTTTAQVTTPTETTTSTPNENENPKAGIALVIAPALAAVAVAAVSRKRK
jgi:hypothetical protein